MRPFSLVIPVKTALCFISNFPLSHIKQRRTHLCSNSIYGRATTGTEPLLILMAAGFHATILNIPLASMIKNARSFSILIWMPFPNISCPFIPQGDVPQKTRRRSCAPLFFCPAFQQDTGENKPDLMGHGSPSKLHSTYHPYWLHLYTGTPAAWLLLRFHEPLLAGFSQCLFQTLPPPQRQEQYKAGQNIRRGRQAGR